MKLRLWTNNVWADVFGNPVKTRDSALIELMKRYKPDVIMLQEMHPNWHDSLLKPALSEIGYAESTPDLGTNSLNYTPILYRNDKFDVISEKFHLFTGPNDYTSKSFSAAMLKDKESGATFGVVSTHFWMEQSESGNMARVMNASELTQEIVKMQGGRPMPVFVGGDFNCDISSDPFRFFEVNGVIDSSLIAENKHNFICSDHLAPKYDPETETYSCEPSSKENRFSLDHIIVKGIVSVKDYTVCIDPEALIVSDHCPVYIDVEI